MLIGINWTGRASDIALLEDWRKVLRLAPTLPVIHESTGKRKKLYLRGIADERDAPDAVTVASNGRRVIKLAPREKQHKMFYGIYTD
jgi:hypothetical protein